MTKQKKLSLKELTVLPEEEQAKYMNSLSAEDQAKLLGMAATRSLNDSDGAVLGN